MPQSSVLGPLLFIIYTADLKYMLTSLFAMYADDVKIFDKKSNFQNLMQDLHVIHNWSKDWLLPLNLDKCTILYVDKKNPRHPYWVGNIKLSCTYSYLDFGSVINSDLSYHVANVTNKANRMWLFKIV